MAVCLYTVTVRILHASSDTGQAWRRFVSDSQSSCFFHFVPRGRHDSPTGMKSGVTERIWVHISR